MAQPQILTAESLATVAGDLLSGLREELPPEDREDFASTVAHAILNPPEGGIAFLLSRWRRYADLMRSGREEEAFDHRPWTPDSGITGVIEEAEADYAAGRIVPLD